MSEPSTIALAGLSLLSAGTVFTLASRLTRRADAIQGDLSEILTTLWHRPVPTPDLEIGAVLKQFHVVAQEMEQAIDRLRTSSQRAGQEPTP